MYCTKTNTHLGKVCIDYCLLLFRSHLCYRGKLDRCVVTLFSWSRQPGCLLKHTNKYTQINNAVTFNLYNLTVFVFKTISYTKRQRNMLGELFVSAEQQTLHSWLHSRRRFLLGVTAWHHESKFNVFRVICEYKYDSEYKWAACVLIVFSVVVQVFCCFYLCWASNYFFDLKICQRIHLWENM